MNLGDLKRSLSRFPADMDDLEVLVQYADLDGKENADLLVYIGLANFRDSELSAICLGTWKAADLRQQERPQDFPEGYKHHPDKDQNEEQN